MNIDIVRPNPEDVPQMSALYATTWLATYPNEEYGISYQDIKQRTDQMKTPERIEKQRQKLFEQQSDPKRFFRVAKEGERVVGVCAGVEKEDIVHMASLYVLPDAQGKGIGGALMEAFLAWANPEKPTRLHVVTYNENAIRFYEKWGFKDTGKRFTEDRFIMQSGNSFPEMEMVLER